MNRRDALTALIALCASIDSRLALSQTSSRLPTLGFLGSGPVPSLEQWKKLRLAAALEKLGWVAGRNYVVELAYADGVFDRFPALAEELVRKRVDIIYADGPEATVAAARATTAIPIVFWGVGFPVEQELIDSYARPGRNVTGVAWNAGGQMVGKLLEIARQFSPRIVRVAYFTFPTALRKVGGGQFSGFDLEMASAAKRLGIEISTYPISRPEDFDSAFKAILASRAQALVVVTTWLSFLERQRILDFVSGNRLIGLYDTKQFVEAGGLVSYGPDNFYLRERAAIYVDRILRGTRPADVPVEQPTQFEFYVNAKTAKALGLTIPQDILLRADRVIE